MNARKCHHAYMRVHPKLSASCLALALMLGSMWWSAASTYVVLHDDARLVGVLAKTLDQPAVRSQLGGWTSTALDQAAKLAGSPEPTKTSGRSTPSETVQAQTAAKLQRAITSTAPVEPLIAAVTTVVVTTRDAAVSQLDARAEPKKPVHADIGPLLGLAKVSIDKKTAKAMGLSLDTGKTAKVTKNAKVTLPLLTADQLDLLQHRYDWMVLVRRWAGWAALALLAVSVATSRYPLRTLAIAAGLVAVIAVVLPQLLPIIQTRLATSDLGALLTPLLAAATARVSAVAVPVGVIAGIAAVGLGGLQFALLRRTRAGRARDNPESDPDS